MSALAKSGATLWTLAAVSTALVATVAAWPLLWKIPPEASDVAVPTILATASFLVGALSPRRGLAVLLVAGLAFVWDSAATLAADPTAENLPWPFALPVISTWTVVPAAIGAGLGFLGSRRWPSVFWYVANPSAPKTPEA